MTLWSVKMASGEQRKVEAPFYFIDSNGTLKFGEVKETQNIHHGLFGWSIRPVDTKILSVLTIAPGQWISVEAINPKTGETINPYATEPEAD